MRCWSKVLSGMICAVFLLNSVVQAAPLAYTIQVPENSGSITQRFKGTNDKTVILVQDAHANYFAQINMADIICALIPQIQNTLNNDDDDVVVGIEGSIGEYSFSELQNYPHKDARITVGRDFVKNGSITGAELAAIISDTDFSLFGLEDKELFLENFNAFLKTYSEKKAVNEFLFSEEENIETLRKSVFSDDLNAFYLKKKTAAENAQNLLAFVPELMNAAGANGIDTYAFTGLQFMVELFTEKENMDEKEFNRKMNLVDMSRIMQDVEELSQAVMHRIAKSAEEHSLINQAKQISILKKILTLTATSDDVDWFNNRTGTLPCAPAIARAIDSAKEFYSAAEKRDKALLENVLKMMDEKNQKAGIIAAGGYHAAGITKMLRERGISFVSVVPNLNIAGQDNLYIKRMIGEIAPLNPLFANQLQASRFIATLQGMELADVISPDAREAIESDVLKNEKGFTALTLNPEDIASLFNMYEEKDERLKNALQQISGELAKYADRNNNDSLRTAAGKLVEDETVFGAYLESVKKKYEMKDTVNKSLAARLLVPAEDSENDSFRSENKAMAAMYGADEVEPWEEKLIEEIEKRLDAAEEAGDENEYMRAFLYFLGLDSFETMTMGQKELFKKVDSYFKINSRGISLQNKRVKCLFYLRSLIIYEMKELIVHYEHPGERSLIGPLFFMAHMLEPGRMIRINPPSLVKQGKAKIVSPHRFDGGDPEPQTETFKDNVKMMDTIRDEKCLSKTFDKYIAESYSNYGVSKEIIAAKKAKMIDLIVKDLALSFVREETYLGDGLILAHSRYSRSGVPEVVIGENILKALMKEKDGKQLFARIILEKVKHFVSKKGAPHGEIIKREDGSTNVDEVVFHEKSFYNLFREFAKRVNTAHLLRTNPEALNDIKNAADSVRRRELFKTAGFKWDDRYARLYDITRVFLAQKHGGETFDDEYEPLVTARGKLLSAHEDTGLLFTFYRLIVPVHSEELSAAAHYELYYAMKKRFRAFVDEIKEKAPLDDVFDVKTDNKGGFLIQRTEKYVEEKVPEWFVERIDELLIAVLKEAQELDKKYSDFGVCELLLYLENIYPERVLRIHSNGIVKKPNSMDFDVQLSVEDLHELGYADLVDFTFKARDKDILSKIFDRYFTERFERIGWTKQMMEAKKQEMINDIQNKTAIDIVKKQTGILSSSTGFATARSGISNPDREFGVWLGEKLVRAFMKPDDNVKQLLKAENITGIEFLAWLYLEEQQHFSKLMIPHKKYTKENYGKVVEHNEHVANLLSAVLRYLRTTKDETVFYPHMVKNKYISGPQPVSDLYDAILSESFKENESLIEARDRAREFTLQAKAKAEAALQFTQSSAMQPVLIISNEISEAEMAEIKASDFVKEKKITVFYEKDYVAGKNDLIMYAGTDAENLMTDIRPHARVFMGKDEFGRERLAAVAHFDLFLFTLLDKAKEGKEKGECITVEYSDVIPHIENVAEGLIEQVREAIRAVRAERSLKSAA